MKNILICCEESNKNWVLVIKMFGMITDWKEEKNLQCIIVKDEVLSIDNYDKVVIINPTKDTSINEFKFKDVEKGVYQLDIRGYEWEDGKITDNAKLNLEQSFQYLTRRISEWLSIRKKLPISFLNNI